MNEGYQVITEVEAARQLCKAPHHVTHIMLQTPPPSELKTSQPYGDAAFASLTGHEFGLPAPAHQMFLTAPRPDLLVKW